jgi:hypothetical protein
MRDAAGDFGAGRGTMGHVPAVRPVSQAEIALSRRLAKPFEPLEPLPADLAASSVRFSPQETGGVPPQPVTMPAPPQPTLAEQVWLDRPIANTTALIPTVLIGTIPPWSATTGAYLDAVRRRFSADG